MNYFVCFFRPRLALAGLLFFILCLLNLNGYSYNQDLSARASQQKAIIVDTDMGSDDWLALLYLLQHPKANLVGITLSGAGLSDIPSGINHAIKLEELTGALAHKNIPIVIGEENALQQTNPCPVKLRMQTNNFYGLDQNIMRKPNVSKLSAIDFLIEQVHKDNGIEILELGPLTNIALAIRKDPSFARSVKRLVIMGGAINVPGNIHFFGHKENTAAEFNIYADPEAAEIVFKSHIPIELVALDATNQVPITSQIINEMIKMPNTEALKFSINLLENNRTSLIEPGYFYAWDPLAAVALMEDNFYEERVAPLSVDTTKGNTYGKTYQDAKGTKVYIVKAKNNIPLKDAWEKRFLAVF